MALTLDDLIQIKNFLNNEGTRQVSASGKKEDFISANFQPVQGELFYFSDEQKLMFSKGDGLEAGEEVLKKPKIGIKADDLHQIALKLWEQLDTLMILSEKRDLIMFNPLLKAFLDAHSEHSDKFSFLRGEKAKAGTLFDIFGDGTGKEPDIRGAFARNLDQGSGRDKDGENRTLGSFQDDTMQKISGQVIGVLTPGLSASGSFSIDGQDHSNVQFRNSFDSFWNGRFSFDSSIQTKTSSANENRPKNFAVLSVVKILP